MLYARCTAFVGFVCFSDRPVVVAGDSGIPGFVLVACISAAPLCGTRLRGSPPVRIVLYVVSRGYGYAYFFGVAFYDVEVHPAFEMYVHSFVIYFFAAE